MMLCNYTGSPTAFLQKQMVLNNEDEKLLIRMVPGKIMKDVRLWRTDFDEHDRKMNREVSQDVVD